MIRTSAIEFHPLAAQLTGGVQALAGLYPDWCWSVQVDRKGESHTVAMQGVDVSARRRAWDQESRARGRHAMARGVYQHAKRRAA